METADEPRRYVTMLAELVQGRHGASVTLSGPKSPETVLLQWVNQTIQSYCWKGVLNKSGWQKRDFVNECLMRLCRQAKENPDWLHKPDMNDRVLERYLRKTALNLIRGEGRKNKDKQFQSLERDFIGAGDCVKRDLPGKQEDDPELQLELFAKIEQTQKRIPEFAQSLQFQPKLLATFTALLYYSEDESSYAGISRYWVAHEILTRPGRHMLPELQEYLQETFPDEKWSNISQRVTILKQRLAEFLQDDPILGDPN